MPQQKQVSQSMNVSLNFMVATNYSPVVHGGVTLANHSSMVRVIMASRPLYLKFQILKSRTLLFHWSVLYTMVQAICMALIAGVQAKVKSIQQRAIYVHSLLCLLYQSFVEATSTIQYTRNLFGILQSLYNFLEASPHRHAKLESVIKEVNSKPRKEIIWCTMGLQKWCCSCCFWEFFTYPQSLRWNWAKCLWWLS